MALILVLIPLAFAGRAAAASAQTQIDAPGPELRAFFQTWVNQSLVPTPEVRVRVTGAICPGGEFMSCASYSAGESTIAFPDLRYLFEGPYAADALDQTRSRLEFQHELGHVFDWTHSSRRDPANSAMRGRFLRIMHISGSGVSDSLWEAGKIGKTGVNPHEQFAMGYSYCAVYPALPRSVMLNVFWGYGYAPTEGQYAQVCTLIRRAGNALPVAGEARARPSGTRG